MNDELLTVVCCFCGDEIEESESITINGDSYCQHCFRYLESRGELKDDNI